MGEETGEDDRASAAAGSRERRRKRFRREVGSVVLGVLIALGIGEVAEAVRWQVRIHRSMAAMRAEMAGNHFNIAERALAEPCVARRLDAIERLLAAARTTASLPQVGSIGAPPARVVEHAAFDVAMAEGILLHTGRDRARDLALTYDLTATSYAERAEAERAAWTELSLIEDAAGPADGDTLLALRQALARARAEAQALRLLADQSQRWFVHFGAPVEYGRYRNRAGLIAAVRASPICAPLAG